MQLTVVAVTLVSLRASMVTRARTAALQPTPATLKPGRAWPTANGVVLSRRALRSAMPFHPLVLKTLLARASKATQSATHARADTPAVLGLVPAKLTASGPVLLLPALAFAEVSAPPTLPTALAPRPLVRVCGTLARARTLAPVSTVFAEPAATGVVGPQHATGGVMPSVEALATAASGTVSTVIAERNTATAAMKAAPRPVLATMATGRVPPRAAVNLLA